MLSVVKRFNGYESFGALFRQANAESLKLTVKVSRLLIIKEILIKLAVVNYCVAKSHLWLTSMYLYLFIVSVSCIILAKNSLANFGTPFNFSFKRNHPR